MAQDTAQHETKPEEPSSEPADTTATGNDSDSQSSLVPGTQTLAATESEEAIQATAHAEPHPQPNDREEESLINVEGEATEVERAEK